MANYRTDAPEIVKDFLRYQKNNLNHSDNTINEYFLDLRTFFRFMKIDRGAVSPETSFDEIDIKDITLEFIKGITKTDINNYTDYLRSDRVAHEGTARETQGLSATSTNRKIACLRSFFFYLCSQVEKLDKDPTMGVPSAKTEKNLPAYLTEEECFRLLDAVSGQNEERDYCIILLFIVSGIRVSEIVGIDLADVRFSADQYFLHINGKGSKERQVYLTESCIEAIQDYLAVREQKYRPKKDEQALFLSKRSNRISVDAVQHLVKNAMKSAGLRAYSPHKLRHTAATLMLQNGVDVRTLQELLGHSSLNTTQVYTHVNSEQLRVAAAANPVGRKASKHK